MNEVAKINGQELAPVSFIQNSVRMTPGQKYLLEFITEKVNKKEAITRNDIGRVWAFCMRGIPLDCQRVKGRKYSHYDFTLKQSVYVDHVYPYDEWIRCGYPVKMSTALSWFERNLGNVIIKGKLLVLPIIEA